MKFYTNFHTYDGKVYVRGYDNGERFRDKIRYKPTLFIPTKKVETEWTNIHGKNVEPVKMDSIYEAKQFFKKYEGFSGFDIYGSNMYDYVYIHENYSKEFDPSKIKIAYIDIEVESGDGFPEPATASQELISIAILCNGQYIVLGTGEYKSSREDLRYIKCSSEAELIRKFLFEWVNLDPDVISGWNVRFFDIPYLVNRAKNVLGESDPDMLLFSPTGRMNEGKVKSFNREQQEYDLVGISTLDYMELYKKTKLNAESWRLGDVAHVELGETKLDYSEVETLQQLYKTDYQKFIDYNIQDVKLCDDLEKKLGYIALTFVIAHDAKVNYVDRVGHSANRFAQVKVWDVLIHNFLYDKKIAIPQKVGKSKDSQFEGAYVKEPKLGMHDWIMSYDLASLYPHLIIQNCISPENLVDDMKEANFDIDEFINGDMANKTEYAMAGNGHFFRRDKQGFLGSIMEVMYKERAEYKNKMIAAQKELELVEKEIDKQQGEMS